MGLRLEGPARQRRRRTLILDAEAHRYDKTLSDISGMDIEAHANDYLHVVETALPMIDAGVRQFVVGIEAQPVDDVGRETKIGDPRQVIRHVRDWLNANREPGAAVLPGAAAINQDHDEVVRPEGGAP